MASGQGIERSTSVLGGAALTAAYRWFDRFVGVISTILLARLLVPDDFGLVAMATLAIALADVLLDLGVNVALIQNRNATQDHYDTAWTLRLIQTSLSTLTLIVAAPWIADYFNDERLESVVRALAFLLLLAGLENIGVIAFQKHMQFAAEVRFMLVRRLAGFVVTVIAAYALRSYWALVVGALIGRAIGTGFSYWVHPMRPRLSLVRFREIFGVSQWMLIRSLGSYLYLNLHKMMVGRWSPAATMGAYSLADEMSAMPASELLAPLNRALFPAFAAAKEDPRELKRLFLLSQGVQTLLVVPASVGLALVSPELVAVALGEKWSTVVPFLQVLAIVSLLQALTSSGSYVLLALNHVRLTTLSLWVETAIFGLIGVTLVASSGALAIAWLRVAAATIGVGISFWFLLRAMPELRLPELLRNIVRPLIAVGIMSAAVSAIDYLSLQSVALTLLAKVFAGVASFVAGLWMVWRVAGRAPGAEVYLLDLGMHAWRRWRQKDGSAASGGRWPSGEHAAREGQEAPTLDRGQRL